VRGAETEKLISIRITTRVLNLRRLRQAVLLSLCGSFAALAHITLTGF
jgi:hypothetical protein